mgnify:CR=1 FL=1
MPLSVQPQICKFFWRTNIWVLLKKRRICFFGVFADSMLCSFIVTSRYLGDRCKNHQPGNPADLEARMSTLVKLLDAQKGTAISYLFIKKNVGPFLLQYLVLGCPGVLLNGHNLQGFGPKKNKWALPSGAKEQIGPKRATWTLLHRTKTSHIMPILRFFGRLPGCPSTWGLNVTLDAKIVTLRQLSGFSTAVYCF